LTASLEDIRLIAEVEFASIVDYVEPMGAKLRLVLSSTYPYHFHDGSQDNVVVSPFSQEILQGFREFMAFVESKLSAKLQAKP